MSFLHGLQYAGYISVHRHAISLPDYALSLHRRLLDHRLSGSSHAISLPDYALKLYHHAIRANPNRRRMWSGLRDKELL
jgi:hypothetical protein